MRWTIGALLVMGVSCAQPRPLVFRRSTPCGLSERSVEVWCDDDANCEYRVTRTGGVYPCAAGDTAGCTAAAANATNECRNGRPDAGVDAPTDVTDAPRPCEPTTELDLLLVIDNSGSMSQEQGLLRAQLPSVIEALAPLASIHFGVVSTDLGAGSVPAGELVPSCEAGFGDDGILRNTSLGFGDCAPTYPSRIFALGAGEDALAFTTQVSCVANLGTGGCGFEQQLEAPLKALSPARPTEFVAGTYAPPWFAEGATGHGDGVNAGFLRANSVLAIVTLTDEEDCSAPNYDIFYPMNPRYAGDPLSLRCSRHPDALYPVSRYVDGFLQLRSRPERLVFVAIAGIPEDLDGASCEGMLSDPSLTYTEDTSQEPPLRLLPTCDTDMGIAFPPRRLVEVAYGLADRGAVSHVASICTNGSGWGDAIVNPIRAALCVP